MTLEEELEPYRAWYRQRLEELEQEWAHQLNLKIARVARAMHPLPVSQWWIDRLKTEHEPLTIEHNKRATDLLDEVMRLTKDIYERYGEEC